jgi:hypothetical protein
MAVVAENPNKYVDNPQLWSNLLAAMEGDEAAARRSIEGMGYIAPGAEPAMEGGTDPNVQHFLDLIAQGSQPAGPDSEFASGRFMEDPPLLEGDADPIEADMLRRRDKRDIGTSMPSRDERQIMATAPGQSLEELQLAAPGDFPTPTEMQEAYDSGSVLTYGARDSANIPPKPETKKLLEDKPKVIEEAAEVEVDETEDPGFAARSGMAMPASQIGDFPTKYTQAVKTNILNPDAQDASLKALEYVKAQYDFMFNKFKIDMDLDALTKKVDTEISSYTTKIDEIAQEEISPPFDGDTTRTVLAVIGAALGAAAATFGGTPNYAMQIIDKAIDREQQRKLKTKEMKLLSAREQRRILQEQRGQMIQFALNKTNQAIAAAGAKGQAAQALASLKMLQANLMQGAQQNVDNLTVSAIKNYISILPQMMLAQGKKGRNYVDGLGVIMGNPNKEELNQIKKEGRQISGAYYEIMRNKQKAFEMLDKLDKAGLVDTTIQSGMTIKGVKGQEYKALEQTATSIFLKFKNDIAKVGQAMSAAEQELVQRLLPQTTLATITLGELRTSLEGLDTIMLNSIYGFQRGSGLMPGPSDLNFQEFYGAPSQQQAPPVPGVTKVTD